MSGTLYAVGVGPGAPDLITLRAVRVLGSVPVILAAASPRNDTSAALETARPHLSPLARILRLDFPMTREEAELRAAWRKAAETTLAVLAGGEDAAFLTIGDPLIYSTFGYLLRTVRAFAPETPVEVIPGITSFQAAAARTETILCEGEESLHILPGIRRGEDLARELEGADMAVILKAYRNFPAIARALSATGRAEDALLASHVERPGEEVRRGVDEGDARPPYMSLILSAAPRDDSGSDES
ncbi:MULTISPECIES: precorrin-2 C(20)-methyltransferase [unclassified Desulfovibrio]|uniref:precorrin-2 C(20)-methyltransferase n=1 Tax=unclassified Desulfovibrio TaxID=2593640 RepID=UPI0013EC8D3C|nr:MULTISPECIES: precorrin-2 C(20)-methyltransferase [unclassified Desulfovibrio]